MTKLSTKEKLEICRHLYEDGAFDPEIARELGVTLVRFHKMYDEQPAFKEFVDMGRTLSTAYWYQKARHGLNDKTFNVNLWTFVMKNQYGWADKVETASKDAETQDLDTLRGQLAKQLERVQQEYPDLFANVRKSINVSGAE